MHYATIKCLKNATRSKQYPADPGEDFLKIRSSILADIKMGLTDRHSIFLVSSDVCI